MRGKKGRERKEQERTADIWKRGKRETGERGKGK